MLDDNPDVLSASELAAVPISWVEIYRRRFRLEVYRRPNDQARFFKPKPHFTCACAVGARGFTTPKGRHFVLDKSDRPSYIAPDSAWAREAGYKEGVEIPAGDPANPIVGAWIRLTDDGIGIHGTANILTLGSRASHGCIRVSPANSRRLYELLPVGTVVRVY